MNNICSVFKKEIYQKKHSNKIILYLHLLKMAEHPDIKEYVGGKPVICRTGQIVTNRKVLEKETGINEVTIQKILTLFEVKYKLIEQQKTNKNRIITIRTENIKNLYEQQTVSDKKDDTITKFINKCKLIELSNDDWYRALIDLKTRIINNYIDSYTIFEQEKKKQLKAIRDKRLNEEFYNEIVPYIENIANENKSKHLRTKYNHNRNHKNKLKREQNSRNKE